MRGISNRIAAPQSHKEAQRPSYGFTNLGLYNPYGPRNIFDEKQMATHQMQISLPTNTYKFVEKISGVIDTPTPRALPTIGFWRSRWLRWRNRNRFTIQ